MADLFIRAGVIGWPVDHSRSPLIHNHWIARYGLAGEYSAVPIAPEKLDHDLRDLLNQGFAGVNVTVPHKQAVLALADKVDESATAIGAANTLVFGGDGAIEARNTDAYGFIENLRQNAPGHDIAAGPAIVLGAGGAARAVVYGLLAAGCPQVRLVNRTLGRALALAADMGIDVTAAAWDDMATSLEGANMLVNTTSLGMIGAPPLEIDLATLPRDALVHDIVYVPLETPLLAAARARGNPVVDGLGMLLHQAAPGFEAWFGVRPEVDDELRQIIVADLEKDA